MPFSFQGKTSIGTATAPAMPPAKITTIGANTVAIPATAIGFNYVLCAAGGGGGMVEIRSAEGVRLVVNSYLGMF